MTDPTQRLVDTKGEYVTRPGYRYGALVTAIYDADTLIVDLDVFDHMWKKDEIIRLYGVNAQEIKRSKAKDIDAEDVQEGYDQRDVVIETLGLDPENFPRKVKYHDVSKTILRGLDLDGDGVPDVFEYYELPSPVWVIIETVKDDSGKFGRLLGVVHKPNDDGVTSVNVNEVVRDLVGGVEFYDNKTYPADYPIRPPA